MQALQAMTSPGWRQRGFTLIELVIAMTLMGLILVILFGGLRLANRSWDTGSERATKTNDMRLVENLIRRAIAQTQPVIWDQSAGNPKLSFTGRPDALLFTGPLPASSGIGGLYLMSLELRQAGNAKELLLRRELYRPDARSLGEHAETTVLVEGVTQARFSYFGSENPNESPHWMTEWQSSMRLPQLVRLSLRTDEPWPDIVAPMRNDTYAGTSPLGAVPGGPIPDSKFFLH